MQSPSASDVSPFAPASAHFRVCGFTLPLRLLLIACGVLVLHTSVTVIEEELFSFPGFRFGVFLSCVTYALMTALLACSIAVLELAAGRDPLALALSEGRRLAGAKPAHRGLAFVFGAYTASTTLAKVSLAYVSIPLQVVVKSGKLLTVMAGGMFITGRTYTRAEYGGALFLIIGISAFSTAGGNASAAAGHLEESTAVTFGVGLLLVTLCADALLGNWQERTMHEAGISPVQMVLLQSLFATGLASVLAVATGEAVVGSRLVLSMDRAVYCGSLFLLYAIVLLTGTVLVLILVDEHGPAAAVLVTLVRKLFSMGMSFALYPKKLGLRHVIGAGLVFAAPYVAQSGTKPKAKKAVPVPLVAAAPEDGQP
jgi:adenosine 3'-phospho 5'-phosphosulfate transporter B3